MVVLDSVTVEFPDGTLTDGARVEVNEVNGADGLVAGLATAGAGVDVNIVDGELIGDANVSFTVAPPSDPDAVPVVVQVADDGTWSVDEATDDNGQIRITTRTLGQYRDVRAPRPRHYVASARCSCLPSTLKCERSIASTFPHLASRRVCGGFLRYDWES